MRRRGCARSVYRTRVTAMPNQVTISHDAAKHLLTMAVLEATTKRDAWALNQLRDAIRAADAAPAAVQPQAES